MDDLFVVEIWRAVVGNPDGEWVYTLKSNRYQIANDHRDMLNEHGYQTKLTPELN